MSSRQRRLLLLSSSSLFWLSCMLTVAPSQPQQNQQGAPQAAPPAAPTPTPAPAPSSGAGAQPWSDARIGSGSSTFRPACHAGRNTPELATGGTDSAWYAGLTARHHAGTSDHGDGAAGEAGTAANPAATARPCGHSSRARSDGPYAAAAHRGAVHSRAPRPRLPLRPPRSEHRHSIERATISLLRSARHPAR